MNYRKFFLGGGGFTDKPAEDEDGVRAERRLPLTCHCKRSLNSSQRGLFVSICFVSLYQRHGVAVLLVLLLCASLFLVYNGSFSGASRDANDTRIRQHEQLRRPTEASVRVAKPHPPVLQGYSGIIDHKVNRCGCVRLP